MSSQATVDCLCTYTSCRRCRAAALHPCNSPPSPSLGSHCLWMRSSKIASALSQALCSLRPHQYKAAPRLINTHPDDRSTIIPQQSERNEDETDSNSERRRHTPPRVCVCACMALPTSCITPELVPPVTTNPWKVSAVRVMSSAKPRLTCDQKKSVRSGLSHKQLQVMIACELTSSDIRSK